MGSGCGCGSKCCCGSGSSTAALQVLIQAAVEQLELFNTGEGEGSNLTPIAMSSVSGATLASDTNYHVALSDSHAKRFIQIVNKTDGDVYISLNGVNDHYHVTAGSSQTLQLGSNKASWDGNVYAAQDTTNPPTTGALQVSAYY